MFKRLFRTLVTILIITAACTSQPTLSPAPISQFPCPIATRVPPAEAPTYAPDPANPAQRIVDPHVAVCLTASSLVIGDQFTVMAEAVDIGLPVFYLYASAGETQPIQLAQASYDGSSQVNTAFEAIDITTISSDNQSASFTMTALAPGNITMFIRASGEVHYGYPGPAEWKSVQSEEIMLEIMTE